MGLCKRNTEERWRELRNREGEDTEKKGKEEEQKRQNKERKRGGAGGSKSRRGGLNERKECVSLLGREEQELGRDSQPALVPPAQEGVERKGRQDLESLTS